MPICTGAVDLGNLAGEVTSGGGLMFKRGDTVLTLADFQDLLPAATDFGKRCPLSALVTFNHEVLGRFTVLSLDDLQPDYEPPIVFVHPGNRTIIPRIATRLTVDGATLINSAFGTAFGFDPFVGPVVVKTFVGTRLQRPAAAEQSQRAGHKQGNGTRLGHGVDRVGTRERRGFAEAAASGGGRRAGQIGDSRDTAHANGERTHRLIHSEIGHTVDGDVGVVDVAIDVQGAGVDVDIPSVEFAAAVEIERPGAFLRQRATAIDAARISGVGG
jgi:hypothetical protein